MRDIGRETGTIPRDATSQENCFQHRIDLFQNVIVAKSYNSNSLTFNPTLTREIVGRLANVAVSIELNGQPRIMTIESEHIVSQRMLAPKL